MLFSLSFQLIIDMSSIFIWSFSSLILQVFEVPAYIYDIFLLFTELGLFMMFSLLFSVLGNFVICSWCLLHFTYPEYLRRKSLFF